MTLPGWLQAVLCTHWVYMTATPHKQCLSSDTRAISVFVRGSMLMIVPTGSSQPGSYK